MLSATLNGTLDEVTLTTTTHSGDITYTIDVRDVTDLAGNVMAPSMTSYTVQVGPLVTAGLEAFWGFEEGSSTTTTDSFGGNVGTLVGGTQWVTGIADLALGFDGSDDHVVIPTSPSLDISTWNGATVAFWVRPDRLNFADEQTVFARWGKTNDRTFQLLLGTDNLWECRTNDSDGLVKSTSPVVQSNWTHVAAVWSASQQLTLYIDGAPDTSDPVQENVLDGNTAPFTLGAREKNGFLDQFFRGAIDNLHVFSRALTDTEIQSIYSGDVIVEPQQSNGQPSGLLPPGTTQTTLSLDTDVNAECRYALTPGVEYAQMTSVFDVMGERVTPRPSPASSMAAPMRTTCAVPIPTGMRT